MFEGLMRTWRRVILDEVVRVEADVAALCEVVFRRLHSKSTENH